MQYKNELKHIKCIGEAATVGGHLKLFLFEISRCRSKS